MRVEAVIFDLDNTLYDEKQFVRSGFKAVSHHMAKKYGIKEEDLFRLFLEIFLKKGREKVFDLALEKLNMYEREIVLEMLNVYRNHSPNITILKDAQNVLSEIKKKYRLGLITDGIKKVQENKIEALNIKHLFNVITYAIEYEGKNNVQAFLTTLEGLKVKPSDSVYIDDNPLRGFATAKKLGIHTIRIMQGENINIRIADEQCKPDFEIRNLRELFGVIRAIEKI